jgi:hypothetical protein
MKHIDVHLHYTRDGWKAGMVDVQNIQTDKNLAHLLTKPLGRIKVETHRRNMGMTTALEREIDELVEDTLKAGAGAQEPWWNEEEESKTTELSQEDS